MKRYLLLRENEESGPYSKEDLRAIGLVRYDLIWEEGKSVRWMYPTELMELSDLPVAHSVRKTTKKPLSEKNNAGKGVPVISEQTEPVFTGRLKREPAEAYGYADLQTFSADKEPYVMHVQEKKFSFQNSFSKTGGLWIVGLMLILVGSAVIMKSVVENFEEYPYRQPEANVEAISYSDDHAPVTQADPSYQNALVTEVVAVDTAAARPVTKNPSVKNLKKQVSITANEFRQGVLGGINDLQLTIKNASDQKLDRVTVQVQFLKHNGQAVKTEHFDLHSVPAGGKKILDVPASRRGVKVKYKVIAVESQKEKTSQRNA